MTLIPAGNFGRGDSYGDGESDERPTNLVYISAFCVDRIPVTKARWDMVVQWASTNGYSFSNAGSAKGTDHPVHSINWYDAVKWCNARSQMEGRPPVYFTDAGLSNVYKTGQMNPQVNWMARGYRLLTESEWEKAARGGLAGKRFPWGDTISHAEANYYSSAANAYDISATRGYHPTYNDGTLPYTSPVASFPANGFGLYDMAGNLFNWCWDVYGAYASGPVTDPIGATSGTWRLLRGGAWGPSTYPGFACRVASRDWSTPETALNNVGFRCAISMR